MIRASPSQTKLQQDSLRIRCSHRSLLIDSYLTNVVKHQMRDEVGDIGQASIIYPSDAGSSHSV